MKRYILALAISALTLSSCDTELNPFYKHGEKITFTTEDKTLRNDDLLGLFIDKPVLYKNVKAIVHDGELKPGSPLYWNVAMPDSAITFQAYYPYQASFNDGGKVTYTAQADQSGDYAFRISDFLYGKTKAAISDPSVVFSFEHKMSKLCLYLAPAKDEKIESVTVNTVYPAINIDLSSGYTKLDGEKVDVIAHKSGSNDESEVYEAIIAPQNVTVGVTVKTDKGTYQLHTSTSQSFAAGQQYSNMRLISFENAKASISLSLKMYDWSSTPSYEYLPPLQGGAELSELTAPGIYSVKEGTATELIAYEAGVSQQSIIKKSSSIGYRVQNLGEGTMGMVHVKSSKIVASSTYSVEFVSYGLDLAEKSFTSTAEAVKVDGDYAWLLDQSKEFGYIIPVK